MSEMWRQVPGFLDYEVSDQGRVRSLKFDKVRILRPGFNRFGYGRVVLTRDGGRYTHTVHSLVLLAFVGPRGEGDEHIRHLDGDRRNNALTNLRYGTAAENTADTIRHGRSQQANRTHCPSGHEYTPENTYVAPSRPRHRYCRACNRIRSAARYYNRKAAA